MTGPHARRAMLGSVLAVVLGLAVAGAASPRFPLGFSAPGSDGLPDGWKPLHFGRRDPTQYTVVEDGPAMAVKAESRRAASGLYREVTVDLVAHPVLTWRWKIDHIIPSGDERRRDGDDYAARVYVMFGAGDRSAFRRGADRLFDALRGSRLPQHAITYVWANRLTKGRSIDSPYTRRVKMVAVESGSAHTGHWRPARVHVGDDYRRLFGAPPPPLQAVAIMTDTDNTGSDAIAYYADLAFEAAP